MAKRGRPNKNGESPMWMLARETRLLFGYHRARCTGEKHSASLKKAVAYVNKTMPGIACSETEVRRALARWQSSHSATGLIVSKADPSNSALTLGLPVRVLLVAARGPRPTYPRANAAEPPPPTERND